MSNAPVLIAAVPSWDGLLVTGGGLAVSGGALVMTTSDPSGCACCGGGPPTPPVGCCGGCGDVWDLDYSRFWYRGTSASVSTTLTVTIDYVTFTDSTLTTYESVFPNSVSSTWLTSFPSSQCAAMNGQVYLTIPMNMQVVGGGGGGRSVMNFQAAFSWTTDPLAPGVCPDICGGSTTQRAWWKEMIFNGPFVAHGQSTNTSSQSWCNETNFNASTGLLPPGYSGTVSQVAIAGNIYYCEDAPL